MDQTFILPSSLTMDNAHLDMDQEWRKLLMEQELFLQQNKKSSAKLGTRSKPQEQSQTRPEQPEKNLAHSAPTKMIFGKIVERNVDLVQEPLRQIHITENGFPSMNAIPRKKPSAFMQKKHNPSSVFKKKHLHEDAACKVSSSTPDGSIGSENEKKLNAMSNQEILQLQKEIHASLPAQLIEKLKKTKNSSTSMEVPESARRVVLAEPEPQVNNEPLIDNKENMLKQIASIQSEDELFEHLSLLHPGDESKKVEWISSCLLESPNKSSELRFDFQGQLMVDNHHAASHANGLYHHESDPHSPGYSIPEIVNFIRSSVPSQRAFGLQLMAKLIPSTSVSSFPRALGLILCHALLNEIHHRTPCVNAVDALHALFLCHSTTARMMPGDAFPHINPMLKQTTLEEAQEEEEPCEEEAEKANVWKIKQLDRVFEKDLVVGMVRSSLIERLEFLLVSQDLPEPQHHKVFQMLITITSHSPVVALVVLTKCAKLFTLLQSNIVEQRDLVMTLRLIQTLVQMSVDSIKVLQPTLEMLNGLLLLKDYPCEHTREVIFQSVLQIWQIQLMYHMPLARDQFQHVFFPLYQSSEWTLNIQHVFYRCCISYLEFLSASASVERTYTSYFNQIIQQLQQDVIVGGTEAHDVQSLLFVSYFLPHMPTNDTPAIIDPLLCHWKLLNWTCTSSPMKHAILLVLSSIKTILSGSSFLPTAMSWLDVVFNNAPVNDDFEIQAQAILLWNAWKENQCSGIKTRDCMYRHAVHMLSYCPSSNDHHDQTLKASRKLGLELLFEIVFHPEWMQSIQERYEPVLRLTPVQCQVLRNTYGQLLFNEVLLLQPELTSVKSCWTKENQNSSTVQRFGLEWMYLPFEQPMEMDTTEEQAHVLACLVQFLASPVFQWTLKSTTGLQVRLMWNRMVQIFVWYAPEMWFDAQIEPALWNILVRLYHQANEEKEEPVKSLLDEEVLVSSLVSRFCDDSFGHAGLSGIITMYLQTNDTLASVDTRLKIWKQIHRHGLLYLLEPFPRAIASNQESLYFGPVESSPKIIEQYLEQLLDPTTSRRLTLERCQYYKSRKSRHIFTYAMSVHHICGHVFGSKHVLLAQGGEIDEPMTWTKWNIMRQIFSTRADAHAMKILKRDIFSYSYDVCASCEFSSYFDQNPEEPVASRFVRQRQTWLLEYATTVHDHDMIEHLGTFEL